MGVDAQVHFAVMCGTKTDNVFNCVGSALGEGNDVVDFDISHAVRCLKRRMLTAGYLAPMPGSLFADGDHEWINSSFNLSDPQNGASLIKKF
jgi:hypothetical protein